MDRSTHRNGGVRRTTSHSNRALIPTAVADTTAAAADGDDHTAPHRAPAVDHLPSRKPGAMLGYLHDLEHYASLLDSASQVSLFSGSTASITAGTLCSDTPKKHGSSIRPQPDGMSVGTNPIRRWAIGIRRPPLI